MASSSIEDGESVFGPIIGESLFEKSWNLGLTPSECCLLFSLDIDEGQRGRRQRYRDYLHGLSLNAFERKKLGFDTMSHGWVKGSQEFRKAALKDLDFQKAQRVAEAEASEMKTVVWERALLQLLEREGKTEEDMSQERKGAPWKVEIAAQLRAQSTVSHQWLAARLKMGKASSVQSLVSRYSRNHGILD